MAVLVADTATQGLAVAVGTDGETLGSSISQVPRSHSKLLQPLILNTLTACGLSPQDLSAIGVGIGPGSYTGVRLAVSNCKAMAQALQLPLYPLSTLWTIAEAAAPFASSAEVMVMPLLYARRQRAFGAVYCKHEASWNCLIPPQVRHVSDWFTAFTDLKSEHPSSLRLVVHDFVARYGVLDQVRHSEADGVMELSNIVGGIGPAMLRLIASGQVESVTGSAIHNVVPDYALLVEAEAKLAESGGLGHGNP